jgi:hypothetical protein
LIGSIKSKNKGREAKHKERSAIKKKKTKRKQKKRKEKEILDLIGEHKLAPLYFLYLFCFASKTELSLKPWFYFFQSLVPLSGEE